MGMVEKEKNTLLGKQARKMSSDKIVICDVILLIYSGSVFKTICFFEKLC
jgi:hypothetical protein